MNFLKAAVLSTIFKSFFLGQASASYGDSSKNVFVRSQASSTGCFECSVERRTGTDFSIDVKEATGKVYVWTFNRFLAGELQRNGKYVAGWDSNAGTSGRYYFSSMDYGVLPSCTDSTDGRFEMKLQETNSPSYFGTGKFQHIGATNDGVCLYRFVVYCNCGISSAPSTLMPTSSSRPSSYPSVSPSSKPSFYPSLNPTENPSSNPTSSMNPSFNPSSNPTSNPTLNSSSSPSSNPTSSNPTSKPTVDASNQAEVTIESEMTIDGVDQDEFEKYRERQIQILQDTIQETLNGGRRRLEKRTRHLQGFKEVTVNSVTFSSDGGAVVDFTITMIVFCDDECSLDEVSDLADSALGDVTSTLTDSISSGAFTETLVATAQEAGSAAFDNVSVDASSLQITVTHTITSDSPTASPVQEADFPLLNQLYIIISGIIAVIISFGLLYNLVFAGTE